jgi:BRCT domain type II-containing protein
VHSLTPFSDVITSSDIADDDNADDEPEAEPEIKKTKTAKKAKAAKGEGAAKKVSKRAAVPEGEPQSLVGHTCTLAGHLHHMDHKTFVQTVEIYGGTYTSKLADANFLVVGANPGKKAQEAADLGLNTITEETFFEAIGADYPVPPAKKAKKAEKAEK